MRGLTDRARLARAFASLRRHGYFARGDLEGSRTDGWTAIGDEETPAVFWTEENARARFKGDTLARSLELQWRGDARLIVLALRRAGLVVADAKSPKETISVRRATPTSIAAALKQPTLPKPAKRPSAPAPRARKPAVRAKKSAPAAATIASLQKALAAAFAELERRKYNVWLSKTRYRLAMDSGEKGLVVALNHLAHLSDEPRKWLPMRVWHGKVDEVRAILATYGVDVRKSGSELRVAIP